MNGYGLPGTNSGLSYDRCDPVENPDEENGGEVGEVTAGVEITQANGSTRRRTLVPSGDSSTSTLSLRDCEMNDK